MPGESLDSQKVLGVTLSHCNTWNLNKKTEATETEEAEAEHSFSRNCYHQWENSVVHTSPNARKCFYLFSVFWHLLWCCFYTSTKTRILLIQLELMLALASLFSPYNQSIKLWTQSLAFEKKIETKTMKFWFRFSLFRFIRLHSCRCKKFKRPFFIKNSAI